MNKFKISIVFLIMLLAFTFQADACSLQHTTTTQSGECGCVNEVCSGQVTFLYGYSCGGDCDCEETCGADQGSDVLVHGKTTVTCTGSCGDADDCSLSSPHDTWVMVKGCKCQ